MKLKLICSALFLFLLGQSCKKATDFTNELINSSWENVLGAIIQFDEEEAYVIDPGNSDLDSNPSVFDYTSTPYIRNIIQTGQHQYSAEIIRTTSSGGTITSVTWQATTITLTEENGVKIIRFSNADSSAAAWTQPSTSGGGGTVPPVTRDTVSVVDADTSQFCKVQTIGSTSSTFKPISVRSGWRALTSMPGYTYRMHAYLNAGGIHVTLYFKDKPTVNKVYNVVSGSTGGLQSVGANEVGVVFNAYNEGMPGSTVNVSVSGGKIIAEATGVEAHSTTANDVRLDFKFIGR